MEDFKSVTLRGAVQKERGHITVSGLESWLHIIFMQLCDSLCYLHYNEIKDDNVVIVTGCSSFFSPVLVDFGKACLLVRQGKKNFHRKKT